MEFALPELLSREDLIRILEEQRQLKIPDIEQLPTDELRRIYKTFAVPFAKREQRTCCQRVEQKYAATKVDADAVEAMDTADVPVNISYLNIIIERKINNSEKRHFNYDGGFFDDESLSIATKRIKIAWP